MKINTLIFILSIWIYRITWIYYFVLIVLMPINTIVIYLLASYPVIFVVTELETDNLGMIIKKTKQKTYVYNSFS